MTPADEKALRTYLATLAMAGFRGNKADLALCTDDVIRFVGKLAPVWRAIETAPQECFDAVLITNGTAVGEATFYEDAGWFWANCHPTDAHDGAVWDATHWQPLPAPPALTTTERAP